MLHTTTTENEELKREQEILKSELDSKKRIIEIKRRCLNDLYKILIDLEIKCQNKNSEMTSSEEIRVFKETQRQILIQLAEKHYKMVTAKDRIIKNLILERDEYMKMCDRLIRMPV